MSEKDLRDQIRWIAAAVPLLLALIAMTFNLLWAFLARRARQRGEGHPSLVPFLGPIFGLMAVALAPTWKMAFVLPAFFFLDIGTTATLLALWRFRRR